MQCLRGGAGRQKNHPRCRKALLQHRQTFQASEARHLHIQKNHIHRFAGHRACLHHRARLQHPPHACKRLHDQPHPRAKQLMIIHQKYAGLLKWRQGFGCVHAGKYAAKTVH